jgi:hypothetical protein
MTFRQCPKRFEFNYNDPKYWDYGADDDKSDMKIWRGNQFHHFAETFFDKINGVDVEKWQELAVHEDEIVKGWIWWFIETEKSRVNDEYFLPVANEVKVYYKDTIDRTGHIDRIDRIGEKELCVVEYKAGASYDMQKSDRLTSMNAEIGFYIQILKQMDEYKDFKITKWKVINPLLQKIWVNRVSPISLKTVESVYAKMTDMIINKKEFPKKVSPLCHYCPYEIPCDPYYGESLGIDFNKPL